MGNNQKKIVVEEVVGLSADNNTNNIEFESKLEEYFSKEKPYLNPEFKITDICLYLGTNRSYVSSFINDQYGKNFASHVNTYRVNEAKEMIVENPNLTLSSISENAGFGSVATFNRAFLKIAGITPTEFIKHR
jgi:AraC-like DNA-binding protein